MEEEERDEGAAGEIQTQAMTELEGRHDPRRRVGGRLRLPCA